ncbi:MAG: sigma-70 family RNA polymerase sigma factor [Anaerolineae bacterium]|nr:sigma-70 family RNA polymerase sigma factor [Anaerolineae bacterium]
MDTIQRQPHPIVKDTTPPDWETIYREQMPRIYNFFRYRVGVEVAEDLTASTFMKAWRYREQYSENLSAFSTWLFSIARNLAVDYFRQKHIEFPLEVAETHVENIPLEEIIQQKSDFARLSGLLKRLSARENELIALKYGGECTNRAIAQMTGLSESNVGTILHRAVQKLREQWESEP